MLWPCCKHCDCNPRKNDHPFACVLCQKQHS